MKLLTATFGLALFCASQASAFCGFYVARSDGALYNAASKVVFVRDGRQSVITMSSDYTGPTNEFALIVPTPTVLQEGQIRTVDPAIITHLDNFTAPRLVEYFDSDPCEPLIEEPVIVVEAEAPRWGQREEFRPGNGPRSLGVTIEAEYAVGDYDIVILSATQSDGLVTYLRQESYLIPDGAEATLGAYIDMGMKFFVARVNLDRHSQSEAQELKPLQIAFTARDFMLPLQLGKINSGGTQDLLIMTLTQEGRVQPTNYPNIRMPDNQNIPTFVRQVFPEMYRATFNNLTPPNTIMTEYAWDMAWCDPCADDPMTTAELRELGASWLTGDQIEETFVTRMHVQYDKDTFAEDLMFSVTADRDNFQGRFVMNVPFEGDVSCAAGQQYVTETRQRLRDEAATLAGLTGWSTGDIMQRVRATVQARYH